VIFDSWDLVESHLHPGRSDRPEIKIPIYQKYTIPVKDFKKLYPYRMRSCAMIDAETWRDFHNPNMFSFLIFADQAETEWTRSKSGKYKGKRISRKKNQEIVIIKGWCWDDEIDQIMPLLERWKIKTVYAHNMTVDLIALLSRLKPDLNHPLEHFFLANPEDMSPICFKGSSVLAATLDIAPWLAPGYSRKAWNHREKRLETRTDYPIEFRDSTGLLTMSLAGIGKSIPGSDFKKGETPQIFCDPDHPGFQDYMAIEDWMVEYAVQDCLVLWAGLQEFWVLIKQMGYHGKAYPLTIGTLGYQMIADSIAKNKEAKPKIVKKIKRSWKYQSVCNDPIADDIMRMALVGGRTQVFDTDPHTTRVVGIDARSMYPSAELGGDLEILGESLERTWPDPTNLMRVKPGDLGSDFASFEGAIHVHWKRPSSDRLGAIADTNEDGLLDWTLFEGTRWLTMAQYRYCKILGYDLDPVPFTHTILADPKDPESEDQEITLVAVLSPKLNYNPFLVVESWYEKRKQMRSEGDPRQILVKLLMNAGSYGKWVERNQDQVITTEESYIHNFSDRWDFSPVAGQFGYATDQRFRRAKNAANCLGAYITDYARMSLNEMGRMIGVENLLYTDTDSWKYLDPDSEITIPEPLLGSDLGQWAIEQIMDFWESVAPKQYRYHAIEDDEIPCDLWKLKIKGCSVGRLTQEEIKDFDLRGSVQFERVIGIRESWRQGHDAGTWITVDKDIGRRFSEN
tara:strand:+ start:1974 stop:4187 length:2214 start_codon:yes stop_codon:yes gene_type:complete